MKHGWAYTLELYDKCCGERPHISHHTTTAGHENWSVQCMSCGDTVEAHTPSTLGIKWNKAKRKAL